jgi:hypothetical protein
VVDDPIKGRARDKDDAFSSFSDRAALRLTMTRMALG